MMQIWDNMFYAARRNRRSMNTKIRLLEDQIVAILNGSDVPIETKRLILSDILNLVTKKADEIVSQEIKEQREEKKNEL